MNSLVPVKKRRPLLRKLLKWQRTPRRQKNPIERHCRGCEGWFEITIVHVCIVAAEKEASEQISDALDSLAYAMTGFKL
jgi:hypothetical protein